VHPYSPGSVYHATKCLDNVLFHFYNRNDGLRVTDLHQGIVWGTQTKETAIDPGLVNRFDYDGDYGTVLNRFLVEAAVGHPLTVHGTGGQTRAFIHITDTVQCVRLAIENPPAPADRVRILNQMTEVHRVRDLAKMVSETTGADIAYVENPRLEADENELLVENQGLQRLGLVPVSLQDGLMQEVLDVAERWRDRVDLAKIPCTSKWRSQPKPGESAMKKMEQKRTFWLSGGRMVPKDRNNPDSFKVRRAKVGGYLDYFSEEEANKINDFVENNLDKSFGYAEARPKDSAASA